MLRYAMTLPAALLASAAFAQDGAEERRDWYAEGQQTLQQMLQRQPNTNRAKNVILFVADGNGVATNWVTRIFVGQQQGKLGEDHVLPYETPEWTSALVKTYNINAQTPDSAPTAGAVNTGVKQMFNTLNITQDATYEDCASVAGNEIETFAEKIQGQDKLVGIVSTARITHATPAAVYAKTASRDWEDSVPEGCTAQKDIAAQLIDQMQAGVIDLAMGGGRRHFVPEGTETDEGGQGRRADGVNLLDRARNEVGAQYAWNTETFDQLDLDGQTPILALFEDSHMEYEADRADEEEPSLADMTRAAIEHLSQNENGYYLEVEAGRVDHANHAGNAARTVRDGQAFAEAISLADEMTNDEDTLIIVTADHSHALISNGYCGRGSPILGLCHEVSPDRVRYAESVNLAADGKPYTAIGYLNGAGSVLIEQPSGEYFGARPAPTQEQATDLEYLQQALIPMSSETHSGEDVAVYAKGPWAHLFDSTVEQSYLFHVMDHAVNAEGGSEAAAGGGAPATRDVTAEDVLPIAEEAREDATESLSTVPDDAESGGGSGN